MRKPAREFSATFQAKLPTLHDMLEWASHHLEEDAFAKKEIRQVEVALEEALVNIIQYGYKSKGGVIEMTYRSFPEGWVEVVLKDEGIPFDPRRKQKPIDCDASLEERSIGGLGIAFMHLLVDDIDYQREGESNVLHLRKNRK